MVVREIETVLDILAIVLIMLNSVLFVNFVFEPEKIVFIPLIVLSAVFYFFILYLQRSI